MSFSIIATQINLCFPVMPPREYSHNPECVRTDTSSRQHTSDYAVIRAEVQDGRGQVILCMTTAKGGCGDDVGLTSVSSWIK